MQTEDRKVNWEQVKRCLLQIDTNSRTFLYQALLIGGAAVWFYRNLLDKANDPDFNIGAVGASDEDRWLSRDIDFTGIFREEAFLLLSDNVVSYEGGEKYLIVEGVKIGFAQAGVAFDPEEIFENARVAAISHGERTSECLVIDPLDLYWEKIKLSAKRGSPNDHLHARLLFEYLAFELVNGAEKFLQQKATVSEAWQTLLLWKRVANRTIEILRDERVFNRLQPLIEKNPNTPFALAMRLAKS